MEGRWLWEVMHGWGKTVVLRESWKRFLKIKGNVVKSCLDRGWEDTYGAVGRSGENLVE